MANNNVAYGRNGAPDFFADDDPLAELARIAGYEERPAARPSQDEAQRREPAFNLEDELLREFEGYDTPRADLHAEPVVDQHVAAAPYSPHLDAVAHDPFAEPDPFVEPAFPSWEDEEPAVSSVAQRKPEPQQQPVLDVAKAPSAPASYPVSGNGFEADLISELETSLMPVASAPAQKSSRPPARAYEPGFRMPLANFNAATAPRHEPTTRQEPVVASQVEAASSVIAPQAATLAADTPSVSAPSPQSIWEAELARVAAFAVAPAVQREFADKVSSTVEPSLERREPVSSPVGEPKFEDSRLEKREPVAALEEQVAFGSGSSSVHTHSAEPSSLADEDFELALDDLDLDFSDLDVESPADVSAAPAHKREERTEPVLSAAPQAVEMRQPPQPMHAGNPYGFVSTAKASAAEPTVSAVPAFLINSRSAAAMGAPVVDARQAAPVVADAASVVDTDGFDPALLADAEEMPESVPDLNVPELPPHEPEKPAVVHSEYDIDLDAELASFLDSANIAPRVPENSRVRSAATAAKPEPVQAKPVVNDGLDDFERALEEDFRRSLAAPFPGRAEVEEDEEIPEEYVAGRRGFSSWVMPASVAGFIGIAGVALFAWYASEGSRLTGDGSPVVIAADTDPVKVAPENPGGKVVPNQDKAVYDRVATGTLDAPKQQSLITSDEQPMDVVQKTLTPESIPLEGEDEVDADGAPIGAAQDARLTPQETAAAASGSQDQLAVMPRKVKTMIVRPDGTLVEQVTDAPALPAAATVAKAEKVAAAPALAEPSHSTGAVPANAATSVADQTKLSDVKVAKATPITGSTPAAAPAASAQKASAPVPGARPAEQPVQVVASVSSQGNVRPTPVSAPAASAAAPAASASSGAGGYFIQVASLPSEADAQKSYKNLAAKFGNVIGGRGVDIAKAEIAGKGTFYRVRIPAGNSKDEAAALCEKLRAAGGTCLIAR